MELNKINLFYLLHFCVLLISSAHSYASPCSNSYNAINPENEVERRAANLAQNNLDATAIQKRSTKTYGEIIGPAPHAPEMKTARIQEYKRTNGEHYFRFEKPYYDFFGTNEWVVTTKELPINKVTGLVDANFPVGKELFEHYAKEMGSSGHLIFVDIGNLGKINKSSMGMQGGDIFLKETADIITTACEKMKIPCLTVTLGGDELGILANNASARVIQMLEQEIIDQIKNSSKIRSVFSAEMKDKIPELRKRFKEICPKGCSAQELKEKLPEEYKALVELSNYNTPSISIGATRLPTSGQTMHALEAAEKQAQAVKVQYKTAANQDATKQGGPERDLFKFVNTSQLDVKVDLPLTLNKDTVIHAPQPITKIPHHWQEFPLAGEIRGIEVSRFGKYSVVEYQSQGRPGTYYKLESYATYPELGRAGTSAELNITSKVHNANFFNGHDPYVLKLFDDLAEDGNGKFEAMAFEFPRFKYLNYFNRGSQIGDEVINRIGQIINQIAVHEHDIKIKFSASKFFVALKKEKGMPSNFLSSTMEKVHIAVENDPTLKYIFEQERARLKNSILQIENQLKNNNNAEFHNKLKAELIDLKAKYDDAQRMKPTVVAATTHFNDGDTAAAVMSRIDIGLQKATDRYNKRLGFDMNVEQRPTLDSVTHVYPERIK